jgi:hypothetical protein
MRKEEISLGSGEISKAWGINCGMWEWKRQVSMLSGGRGVGSQWVPVSSIVAVKNQEAGDRILVPLDVLASKAVGAVFDQVS